MNPVIYYRYSASPFSTKLENVLLLKHIAHKAVEVSMMLPRAEITDLLGITYRRIPILAIGNDVYCDTSLIATVLERRFPPSEGYGTIFPAAKHGGSADTGMIRAFSQFYADLELFPLVALLLPWEKFPPAFLEDRNGLRGDPINVDATKAAHGLNSSRVLSHLALLEQQLSDGREWVFDTELPGLADVSLHHTLAFLKSFRGASETFFDGHRFPHVIKWFENITKFWTQRRARQSPPIAIDGVTAAKTITSSLYEPYDVVGFDEQEAKRLSVVKGGHVSVAPLDTGRNYPTIGKLVGLNLEEVTLEVQARDGIIRCHFPRLGFSLKPVAQPLAGSKL